MFLYLIAIFAFSFYFYFKYKYSFWSSRGFLSVPPTIPLGSIGELGSKNHTSDVFKRFYDEYKDITPALGFYFFATPILLPTDPELLKDIFVRNFDSFQQRGLYHNKNDQLTHNLFFMNGVEWKAMRHTVSPTFTSGKMKMMFENVSGICDGAIKHLKATADVCRNFEMKELLASLTTEIIISVAFGLEAKCIGNPKSELRVIANKIFNPPPLNALKFAILHSFQDFSRSLDLKIYDDHTSNFFKEMVQDTIKYREENKVMRNDFLQLLIQLKNGENAISTSEIIGNCFMFFLAGHETSSTAVTFALYELAKNQEIQDRLRAEINKAIASNDGKITYDGVMEMKYLDLIVSETLRMYPVVDVQFRKCCKDFKIPNTEMIIPKDVSIMISSYALHHDDRFWVNPSKFDPERFTEENVKKRPPFTYIPFSEGPRSCIGLRFGLMQTKIVLVKLLQNFKFLVCEKTTIPMKFKPGSAFQTPIDGMWLKIENT